MASERTLSIIKPDALERGLIGSIIQRFETDGLKPAAIRLKQLAATAAEVFILCTASGRTPQPARERRIA